MWKKVLREQRGIALLSERALSKREREWRQRSKTQKGEGNGRRETEERTEKDTEASRRSAAVHNHIQIVYTSESLKVLLVSASPSACQEPVAVTHSFVVLASAFGTRGALASTFGTQESVLVPLERTAIEGDSSLLVPLERKEL